MWIDAKGVKKALEISLTYAYKIINELQEELKQKGYCVNPNKKLPVVYFCERYGLEVAYVKALITEP